MESLLGLVLVISVVLFIVGRELLMWYWKINEVVGLLNRIAVAVEANLRLERAGRPSQTTQVEAPE